MTLDVILGSRNRVRVLRTLFRQDGHSGRRIAALAHVAPSACKVTLEELAAVGLILRTVEKGRTLHELNRSHRLAASLAHLFEEEARLPRRMAASLRAVFAQQNPAPELLCIGLTKTDKAVLAVSSVGGCDGISPLLANVLRFEFGLGLDRLVADLREIPPSGRLWTPPAAGGRDTVSTRDLDRALRFFGVSKQESANPVCEFHERGKSHGE